MSKRAPTSLNSARQKLETSLALIDERKAAALADSRLLKLAKRMHSVKRRALEVHLREEVPRINESERILHELIEAHNLRCRAKRQGYHQIEIEKR